jgi:ankyrin repeat protein
VKNDDADGLKALHDSGKWTDVNMVVDNAKDSNGNTLHFSALAVAADYNRLGVMHLLIQLGAKVDEDRERHLLPSNQAAAAGSIDVLKLLKENGCNLSAIGSKGLTPVHSAAMVGHLPVLELFHSWDEDMQVVDAHGHTPLDWAKSKGHTDCVEFLKQHSLAA